jgi:hypothetical protein
MSEAATREADNAVKSVYKIGELRLAFPNDWRKQALLVCRKDDVKKSKRTVA